jgi:hypothetical protein
MAALALLAGAAAASCRPYKPAPPPEQPIAFYHNVHAGTVEEGGAAIPCMYCHYTADRSVSAGIPPVQLCVGCHVPGSSAMGAQPGAAQLAFPQPRQTADGGVDSTWHREALKLLDYWRNGQSIPWVRIHKIPEHAKFPHFAHVNVGLQCQTCHGPVERMEEMYQFSSLRMGWCIDCHRGEMALSEEEEQAVRARSSFIRRVRDLEAAGNDVRGLLATYPNQRASTDCMVCHY